MKRKIDLQGATPLELCRRDAPPWRARRGREEDAEERHEEGEACMVAEFETGGRMARRMKKTRVIWVFWKKKMMRKV